ncbi:uncharacterized protein LOC127787601 [Diospyros lotus]|uniref:uncharacterized protein LOC127787601 n=1 Tax=Diospyros lotus TaxID=55363 RepID=UPI002259D5FE|nr:uncharacterized protein LOC127787601 [Diospyros lotus]
MGNCRSCQCPAAATAKLIFFDGELQEFSSPVKVSDVVQQNPGSFLCNSDQMDFNDFVSSLDDDEELQPGQLYFALPLRWLSRPLLAEDMASLAVKASLALARGGCGRKYCTGNSGGGRVDVERDVKFRPTVVSGGGRRQGLVKARVLTRELSMITEEQ